MGGFSSLEQRISDDRMIIDLLLSTHNHMDEREVKEVCIKMLRPKTAPISINLGFLGDNEQNRSPLPGD